MKGKTILAQNRVNRKPLRPRLEALKAERRWVLWSYEVRDGKQTKVPRQTDGSYARVNDPTTWTDYYKAKAALSSGRFAGVGIVLGDGLAGVDIDCKDYKGDGIPPILREILDQFPSYAETSPSGKGVHILLFGKLPPGARKRATLAPGVEIEIYDRDRYFTFTGEALNDHDITEQQEALNALLARLGMLPPAQNGPAAVVSVPQTGGESPPLSDEELLARIFESKNGPEIQRLFSGDWSGYPSQSEADLALVGHLLWWTNGDIERADRLFRRSGLYRKKWDEKHFADGRTYGQATLERALQSLNVGYTPPVFVRARFGPERRAEEGVQTEKSTPAETLVK